MAAPEGLRRYFTLALGRRFVNQATASDNLIAGVPPATAIGLSSRDV